MDKKNIITCFKGDLKMHIRIPYICGFISRKYVSVDCL